ncbi:MAG: LysR family transcriptional regulator [Alphaproteobacteria bacterium]
MNLRQMRYFVAVYEEGGFGRAATREHCTQSGISQQIRQLEERLGATLFERNPHGVEATLAGREYYQRCVPVLHAARAADQHIVELRGQLSGTVRAGLIPTLTKGALASVLVSFTAAHPHVDIHITEAYSQPLTDQVVAGALDFAIVPVLPPRHVPGLSVRVLATEEEMLLSGPKLGLQNMVPLPVRELGRCKLVLPSPENSRRPFLEGQFERAGVAAERIMSMDGMTGTFEFIAASDWATILPVTACIGEVSGKRLRVSPLIEPSIPFDFILIEPARQPLSSPARAFVDAIEAELDSVAAAWRRTRSRHGRKAPPGACA